MDAEPKRVSPHSAFLITETKEGGMMVFTTTQVTQMHVVKRRKTDKKALNRSFGVKASEGPWLGEEREKVWGKYYEVLGYSPFQHVVTISVEAKTSVCQRPLPCPPLVLLPLCSPLSFLRIPGARSGITMLTTAPGARWRLPK